jgi:hypothetical protein
VVTIFHEDSELNNITVYVYCKIFISFQSVNITPRHGNPPSRTTHRDIKKTGAARRFVRCGVKEFSVAHRRARLAGKERSEQTSPHRPRRTLADASQI